MSTCLRLHHVVHPAAAPTQLRTAAILQTLLQHISALQARIRALENHVDALNKTLGPWDTATCSRETVKELFEGNGQPDAEG